MQKSKVAIFEYNANYYKIMLLRIETSIYRPTVYD